jgi:hypothetical protein
MSLARWEKKHGKGKALTVLAHKLARAVYSILQRETACDRQHFLQSEHGVERMSPPPNWLIRDEPVSRAWFCLVHYVAHA